MNDGEDEEEEPVKKRAIHEEGNMPGSSSTDPMSMPMQERSPAPTASTETGQEEASAAGRKRDVDENWDECGIVERVDSEKVTDRRMRICC